MQTVNSNFQTLKHYQEAPICQTSVTGAFHTHGHSIADEHPPTTNTQALYDRVLYQYVITSDGRLWLLNMWLYPIAGFFPHFSFFVSVSNSNRIQVHLVTCKVSLMWYFGTHFSIIIYTYVYISKTWLGSSILRSVRDGGYRIEYYMYMHIHIYRCVNTHTRTAGLQLKTPMSCSDRL